MNTRSLLVLLVVGHLVGTTNAFAQEVPTIRDIRPDTVVGRGQITILGSNFTRNDGSVTTVWLDDKPLSEVAVNSASEIEVIVPTDPAPSTSLENEDSSGHFRRTIEVRVDTPDEETDGVAKAAFVHVTWRALLQLRSAIPVGVYLVVLVGIMWRFKANLLLSETKQWSLSKIQMALWTVLLSFWYVVLSAIRSDFMDITEGMFWIMGISSTTAVGAKAIVIKNLDRLDPKHPSTLLSDYDSNVKAYRLSLHRCQIALWTIIVAAMFVESAVTTMNLPDIPNQLLLLMGISGGAYLGFNFPQAPPESTGKPS